MWTNASDVNDFGEPVRLYLPIAYKFNGEIEPTISVIGGTPSFFEIDDEVNQSRPICDLCGDTMPLLVQLHVPAIRQGVGGFSAHRSFYVFGCNRASCSALVLAKSSFSVGGGGCFVCRRSQKPVQELEVATKNDVSVQCTKSTWDEDAMNSQDLDDDNPWGNVDGVDDLEEMFNSMETNGPKGVGSKTKPTKKQRGSDATSSAKARIPQFTPFEIRAQQEPPGKQSADADSLTEDAIGIASSSDEKIQAMLARYLAEEDDEEILSAIRGSISGAATEKEELLPEGDRVMLTFMDRVKRAPRQVLRYAKGGEPMWSVPTTQPLSIPNCPCGAKRCFEFQVMPSLLHVLEVDSYALDKMPEPLSDQHNAHDEVWAQEFSSGGQNWGCIAVYSCSKSCNVNREDFVIIQRSLDGIPERRGDGKMVVEVQMFDDDDNGCP